MLRTSSRALVFLAAALFGCGSSGGSSLGQQDAGAGGAAGSFSAPVGGTSGGAAGSSSAPVGGSASGCTTNGASCANTAGCGWWGCWQYDQDPPGAYVRNFVSTAKGNSHIPMFTYYQILQAVERNDLRRLLRDRAVPPPVRLPEGRPCLPWARRPSRYCAPVWPAVAG